MRRVLLVIPLVAATFLVGSPAMAQHVGQADVSPSSDELVVVVTEIAPFVERRGDTPDGFYVEIWEEVAAGAGLPFTYRWVEDFSALVDALESGEADVAVAPLAPTSSREEVIDFTSAVVASGPQLGIHERLREDTNLLEALFNGQVFRLLLVAVLALFVLANVIWLVERYDDSEGADFDERYLPGLWDAFWWAAVTVTTVGYGDIAPRSVRGRVVALISMLLSLFLVGAFVSQVTSRLEAGRDIATVQTLDDARRHTVGVIGGSSFEAYLEDEDVTVAGFASQGEVFEAAADGRVDVIVANPFALATLGPASDVTAVGDVLYEEFETFGLRQGSPLREPLNKAIADLQVDGTIERIINRWVD